MKLLFKISEKAHGPGPANFAWQRSTGNYIAVAGTTNVCAIYDRHGELVEDISLSGVCTALAWDKNGDVLAICNGKTNSIILWNSNNRRITPLDSSIGVKDTLTFAAWSRVSQVLAVGNSKGNLLLYNHQTQRKVPVIGKHTKKITCGSFSDSDLLALGAEDNQMTVSNLDGDTLYTFQVNEPLSHIQFAQMKETERTASGESTISAVVGTAILMLVNMNDADNPINLQFQQKYGDIRSYKWYGDGYILIGFEHGYVISISTHVSEIGQEIFAVQEFKNELAWVTVCPSFGKAVSLGDTSVKLREMNQLSDVYSMVTMDTEDRGLDKVDFSPDGQLMVVSGATGALYTYLTRLPVMADVWGTKLAVLTSLTEVTVLNDTEQEHPVSFMVDIEPTAIAIGPLHVAVAMNNRAWFYVISGQGAEQVRDFEYIGSVHKMKLNSSYVAACYEGKLHLQSIEVANSDEDSQGRMFPDADKSSFKITAASLTPDMLITATDGGHLQYFLMEDWKYVNEFRHITGIIGIYPEPDGTRVCILDDKHEVYVYNPANDSFIKVNHPNGASFKGVLWENWMSERDIFIAYDSTMMHTFILYRDTIEGSQQAYAGSTKLPFGHTPLLLHNGQVTCHTQSGRTNTLQLQTHVIEKNLTTKSKVEVMKVLNHAMLLKRWTVAWTICETIDTADAWKKLGETCMRHMDLQLANKVYRHIGDVGMVWALEDIAQCEDRNLLAGVIGLYLHQFDLAESLFLESTSPTEALDMRRDLLEWDKALQLAKRLAPDEIPFISKEYAQQLEFTGEYNSALSHYEKGLMHDDQHESHNEICQGGIARTSIRLGDLRHGVKIAMESQNRTLKRECGQILEDLKQYAEASQLYEKGQYFDKAAVVCMKAKNWPRVGQLLQYVKSPKLHGQYGKAMEAEKKYKLAADAYRSARDYDNLVRILLDHVNSPEEAVKVVKQSRSVEGAKLVAKFFLKLNDHSSAIQFLVISQCHQEALKLAEQHDKMEIYAEVIGDDGTQEQYENMARYFERNNKPFLAGKYFYKSGHYAKALSYLLTNGEDQDSLLLAIDCVAQANDNVLTTTLIDFLIGENDGLPKDAKYIFRLYMALKMFKEAAKTAIVIAREEQSRGKYRIAHDVLVGMYGELKNQQIVIPIEMEQNLMLVHSYLVVLSLSRRKEHKKAARMLIRVSKNISKFPEHAVGILTSTVIECYKVGLKQSAVEYARQLMRPEYRKKISEQYKKKETGTGPEEEEPRSKCPFCETNTAETELNCDNCKSRIPYCIVTGRHMTLEDFSMCPNCNFPAYHSEFKKYLEWSGSNRKCPMCTQEVAADGLRVIQDVQEHLKDIERQLAPPMSEPKLKP